VGERLAIDPNDNNILYFGSRHDGLWISKDTALTWNKVENFPVSGTNSSGARRTGLSFVVFDPATGTPGKSTGTIYVGGDRPRRGTAFLGTNAGDAWLPVPGQPTNFVPIHAAFDTQGVLYLVYDSGVGPGASGTERCGNSTPGTARGPISPGDGYQSSTGRLWRSGR